MVQWAVRRFRLGRTRPNATAPPLDYRSEAHRTNTWSIVWVLDHPALNPISALLSRSELLKRAVKIQALTFWVGCQVNNGKLFGRLLAPEKNIVPVLMV